MTNAQAAELLAIVKTVVELNTELASRVIALEARIRAFAAPTPVDPVPTPQPTHTVDAYKAFHLRSTIKTAQLCNWQVDGKRRGGFNAAHAAEGGTFSIQCDTDGTAALVAVKPTSFTDVPVGSDLAPLLKNGARLRLQSGEYTLSKEVQVNDVVVLGPSAEYVMPTIKWTGTDWWDGTTSPKSLITTKNSAFWNVSFVSGREYDKSKPTLEKGQRPTLFHVLDDSTFVRVDGYDFNRMFNGNGRPARVYIRDCYGVQCRTYFAWYEGSDWCLYDNRCDNVIFEHVTRGGPSEATTDMGWQYVAFDGNWFTNKDNRPTKANPNGDPNDDAKGTIVMQGGAFGYRRNNTLNGPHGVGPLAVADNGSANQRTEHVVVDRDQVTKALEIWPGASDLLVIGVAVEPKAPRNVDGPKKDPRRITGLKLVGVAAPKAQAWMDAPEASAS